MSGSSYLSCFLVLLSAAFLGLNLWKDWQAHGGSLRRYGYATSIILYVVISVGNIYLTDKKNESERRVAIAERNRATEESAENRAEIIRLQQIIKTEQTSHDRSNSQFLESLGRLYGELSKLKTAAKTSELRQQIVNLQEQLKSTERAVGVVTHGPKAKLEMGFSDPQSSALSTQGAVKQESNGSVTVELWVVNHSEAAAIRGGIYFRICDECKLLKEPEGSLKAAGSIEQDRSVPFQVIAPSSRQLFTFVILPPATPPRQFTIGMRYACETCVNDTEWHDVVVGFSP